MKDAEKSLVGNTDSYTSFKCRLETLPDNVVVIGSHTQIDNRKEKVELKRKKKKLPLFLFY